MTEQKAGGYSPDLATLKRMYEESQSLTYTARREAQIDLDYYDGFQWTAEERAALRKRKQPDLVFNWVRRAINGSLGVIKQGETDPRAWPRNPGMDEQSADVVSKTLRFAADKTEFDAKKLEGAFYYMGAGFCAAIVEVDEDRNVAVETIRFEEHFYDPRSRRRDFKDARYQGIAKWRYADEVVEEYPEAKQAIEQAIAAGAPISVDDINYDRPNEATTPWIDQKKRRVMVVEMYHLDGGVWRRCVFHAGGVLAATDSPYLDDKKRPCCPIEAQACYIDRENNRYGLIRDMRSPQDQINKARSKIQHILNTKQVQEVQPGSGMGDLDTVRSEAARPDGVIPSGWQVVQSGGELGVHIEVIRMAIEEIERMAPNPAILGRQGESQSGRAQLVRQQAGLTEQAVIFGGIEDWELRLYRQMWNRIRQFWTAPMHIRVTDDDGAPEFVGLNQPQVAVDPMSGQQVVLGYENPVAELDVDIILDAIPDTANVQQEQFQVMADLAKVGALGPNAGPLLLEASSLPNKREIMDKLEQSAQQPNPQAELQMRGAAAGVAKTEAEAALTGAKAQNEMMKPQLEALQALAAANQTPPPGATGASPFGA